jgi:hypothetical protein
MLSAIDYFLIFVYRRCHKNALAKIAPGCKNRIHEETFSSYRHFFGTSGER